MKKIINEVRIRALGIDVSDNPTFDELWNAFKKIYDQGELKADFILWDYDDEERILYSEWGDEWERLDDLLI